MTEQRPVRERLRELAAKERGYLAGLSPPLAWSDRAPWEAGIRQAIRTLDKIEAAAITELDTLERRAEAAERAIRDLPLGTYPKPGLASVAGWNRYDTDDEHVLHLFSSSETGTGESWDIRVPKARSLISEGSDTDG